MRIQHNIAAINTHRLMNFTNKQLSNTLEKLSSGYRINRAGDDAAGLAISEKMRGQIRGLDMAQKNTQDAISLVQTAEGALTEVHAMLQRGRELATQASNDTNTQFDREKIQEEITQLNAEIDHLADRTEFNTKKLLKGTSSLSISPNGATGTSGASTVVSDEQIKALTERVLNSMLGQSEKMVQEAYGITPNDKFKVDVSYVDEAEGGRVAWVSVRSEWYVDGSGNKFDMKAFPTDLVLDKADFFSQQEMWVSHDRIIAHEMVHAIMGAQLIHLVSFQAGLQKEQLNT